MTANPKTMQSSSGLRAEVANIIRLGCQASSADCKDSIHVIDALTDYGTFSSDLIVHGLTRFLSCTPHDNDTDTDRYLASIDLAISQHQTNYASLLLKAIAEAVRARTEHSTTESVLFDVVYRKGYAYGHEDAMYNLEGLVGEEVTTILKQKAEQGVAANVKIVQFFQEEDRSEREMRQEVFAIAARIAQLGRGDPGFHAMHDECNFAIWKITGERIFKLWDPKDTMWRVLVSDLTADCERVKALCAMLMFLIYFESVLAPSFMPAVTPPVAVAPLPAPAAVSIVDNNSHAKDLTPQQPANKERYTAAIAKYLKDNESKFANGIPEIFKQHLK